MSWIKNTAIALGSVIAILLALELVLRFLPVYSVIRTGSLTETSTASDVSAVPNATMRFSSQWNFANAKERETNNRGFFSNFDYKDGYRGIFVVGDSFVEATQVSFEQTFHQLLSGRISRPVPNVALSGAPLSQYEAYASEICERYEPTLLVIPIVGNDFDESLRSHARRAGFFHYDESGQLSPTPYSLSPLQRIMTSSALVRYIYFNLDIRAALRGRVDAPAPAEIPAVDYTVHERAANIFLEHIGDICLPPERIVFVVDAWRSEQGIYKDNGRRPYMDHFIEQARKAGFEVVDMSGPMREAYERDGERFEYPFDAHWNVRGHELVADTLHERLVQHVPELFSGS